MLDHRSATPPLRNTMPSSAAAPDANAHSTAQALLARVMRGAIGVLEPVLVNSLDQLEKSLFTQADTGSCELQQAAFDAMRQVRRYRADLLPAFLSELQARAEGAASPHAATDTAPEVEPAETWSLLDNAIVEETALIDALAARMETRLHLPLHLLGHRLGTVLQRDPFDARSLPIGPHALLRALHDAGACLDLAAVARHALLRQFDRCLTPVLAELYGAANACLADAGILPELRGYQTAPRNAVGGETLARAPATPADTAPARPSPASDVPAMPGHHAASGPAADSAKVQVSARQPLPVAGPASMRWQRTSAADDELFGVMRGLLDNRRALLARFAAANPTTSTMPKHPVAPAQVNTLLRDLQRIAPAEMQVGCETGAAAPRHGLKSLLLSHLQQSIPREHTPELPAGQDDVVDLVDMLFDHLLKGAPTRGIGAPLLARLQIPLLRVALEDTGFFTRSEHPARRMLDALADAGLYWHDDADADDDFGAMLRSLVDRVASEFDGDLAVFEVAGEQLQQQLATRMRKAAIAERRHVEAERGRERLERARAVAADAIRCAIGEQLLPRFVRRLLTQAWTDVLALTVLRGSDGERQFARQMDVATWLVRHGGRDRAVSAAGEECADPGGLQQELAAGLCQIGYHLNDAESLARAAFGIAAADRQAGTDAVETPDAYRNQMHADAPSASMLPASAHVDSGHPPAAAVEHTLVAHERLGAACEIAGPSDRSDAPETVASDPGLDPAVRQNLDQLRRLPFGTWFDLTATDGRKRRCRMSWFSPMTGRCLFVNHRGQRIGDHTLTWLATEMQQGRARIAREAQTSVVDSAWQTILGMLRAFVPKTADLATA